MVKLEGIEKNIEYTFAEKNYLIEALTHRSYLNENNHWKPNHNERLEFLGDAVLELIVTEEIYHRYPDYSEGKLTPLRAALVNYITLAHISKNIDLESFLLLSKGEAKESSRGREVILGNAMEALIGAIYLDGGYVAAKKFINKVVMPELQNIFSKGSYRDAKSLLQERTQADHKVTPVYRVLEEKGPEHEKKFLVGVYINSELIAQGEGFSKQEGELEAAKKAMGVI